MLQGEDVCARKLLFVDDFPGFTGNFKLHLGKDVVVI